MDDWDKSVSQYRRTVFGEENGGNAEDEPKPPTVPRRKTKRRLSDTDKDSATWESYIKKGSDTELWYHAKLNKVSRVDPTIVSDEKEEGGHSLSAADIIRTLRLIETQVDAILEQSHALSSLVCEDLREIRTRVINVHTQIQQGGSLDDRDDVEALVEFEKLEWNFHNFHVDQYRREAIDTFSSLQANGFTAWHMPEYKCPTMPLPTLQEKTLMVHVNLPKVQPIKNTKVPMGPKDTVEKAIDMAFSKCGKAEGLGDKTTYVLKAEGHQDFMTGTNFLWDYEHVRVSMRDGKPIRLSLVRRPEPTEHIENVEMLEKYADAVKETLKPVAVNAHRGISTNQPFWEISSFPLSELHIPMKFKLIGMDNATEASLPRYGQLIDGTSAIKTYVKVYLFHGVNILPSTTITTSPVEISADILFNSHHEFPLHLSKLPREVRIAFELWVIDAGGTECMVAWCVQQMIDETGKLTAGQKAIKLWPVEARGKGKHSKRAMGPEFVFRATNRDNCHHDQPCVLLVQFDDWELPVVAPLTEKYKVPDPHVVGEPIVGGPKNPSISAQEKKMYNHLVFTADCLEKLTDEDKELLWKLRHNMLKFPNALPKFLQCVNWASADHKFEAHRILKLWQHPIKPEQALELLDAKYPDFVVRNYAVEILKKLEDESLRMYMLQLTQCLKFEPYHHSPLSRFLIERAIRNPYMVGHYFFWHLKAELHAPPFMERYGVLLEHYLSNAGRYASELRKQNSAVLKLQKVAEMIVRLKRKGRTDEEAMEEYRRELKRLNDDFFEPMGKFQIPFNPKLEATKLIISKCRYMSSKMVPLWLVFQNADEDTKEPIYIIFKSGDDLRQDILTLQLLRVMDRLWLSQGLDLKMTPYEVIATGINDHGEGVGMIQVVMNSDTTSGIQLKYGGGAVGALLLDPIDQFIRENNKEGRYEKAVDIFTASCAGYCVATYVLGIGDRHNGNIMVKKDGHLFHIDFGHFLGNFKKKFGVNRERAAFVFTPEMAFVIGGEKYRKSTKFKEFMELTSEAYKILRENASFLEQLFALMVAAGMPELMTEADIYYMRDKLALNLPEKVADQRLGAEIRKSLGTGYRRIDNMIHNLRHG
eukprot:gb/GEZN01000959.1/.p1 GENE.gb/GEZN01000959.1/~~gb/GEZN01000959.1/.p1  ORF type:complete len:1100 (-),score=179.27 gb/GEZN01000959.1/:106-3405(-)